MRSQRSRSAPAGSRRLARGPSRSRSPPRMWPPSPPPRHTSTGTRSWSPMATSRPAHVLGDVLVEYVANDGTRVYVIEIQTHVGRQKISVQSQYVLVGD